MGTAGMGISARADKAAVSRRRKGRAFTDVELLLLVVMPAEGIGYKRIGRKLGRSPWSLMVKYWSLG